MSDIPADIMEAARRCAETVCRNLDYDDCTIEIGVIARAILAERIAQRERDARVADAFVNARPVELPVSGLFAGVQRVIGDGMNRASKQTAGQIAAAIRGKF